MKFWKFASSMTIAIVVSACGGGEEGSTSTGPVNSIPTSLTGIFLDGPVANIGYRTETKQGVTNDFGGYDYLPGESVTFFIGDLEFPTVKASGAVTPHDLAGTTNTSDPTVVNMIRLLQSLDEDADHINGIKITETVKAVATQVDFNLSVTDFEASPAVTNLMINVGVILISEAQAIQSFEASLDKNYSDAAWEKWEASSPPVISPECTYGLGNIGLASYQEYYIDSVRGYLYPASFNASGFEEACMLVENGSCDPVDGCRTTWVSFYAGQRNGLEIITYPYSVEKQGLQPIVNEYVNGYLVSHHREEVADYWDEKSGTSKKGTRVLNKKFATIFDPSSEFNSSVKVYDEVVYPEGNKMISTIDQGNLTLLEKFYYASGVINYEDLSDVVFGISRGSEFGDAYQHSDAVGYNPNMLSYSAYDSNAILIYKHSEKHYYENGLLYQHSDYDAGTYTQCAFYDLNTGEFLGFEYLPGVIADHKCETMPLSGIL